MHQRFQTLLFCFLLLRGSFLFAQDPIFSQFYAAPLQLNPAFTGTAQAPFIAANYRMQYPSFVSGAAYSTFAISYDQGLRQSNSAIGISIMTDDAGQGIFKKTYASALYSYKVNIREDIQAKIGVEAGLIQSSLNWDKLVFYDQLDPITGGFNPDGTPRPTQEVRPTELNNSLFDLSTGLLINAQNFYVGVSAKHLATPNEGFINANQNLRVGLPIRWSLHGGYEITLKKGNRSRPKSFVTPSLLVVKQSDFLQVVGGAYAGFGSIFTGLWYRQTPSNSESVIFTVGFRQDYFKVGYSYDFPVGVFGTKTGGSHELSLTINLDPNPRKYDLNDCYQMFR
ncbi:MAG: PorP/SprF family type IX secretion system membrane protein [Saprospiraceae bacterium]|nr:PorP/SprF family type IX secretion system membrane protein [Saprospiraceae bacterium]